MSGVDLQAKQKAFMGILAKINSKDRGLREAKFEGFDLGAEGAIEIAKVLPSSLITALDFRGNRIGDAGVQSLAEILPKTQITDLSLAGNQISDTGVQSLAKILPQTKVITLNLEANQIGDAGVQSLAEILSQTRTTILNLEGNQIGDVGNQSLAETLSHTKITTLSLKRNWIRDAEVPNIDLSNNPFNYNELISTLLNLSQTKKMLFTLKITNIINLTIEDKKVCLCVNINHDVTLEKVLKELEPKFPVTKIQINFKENRKDEISIEQLLPLFENYPESEFEIKGIQKLTHGVYDKVEELSEKFKLKELSIMVKKHGYSETLKSLPLKTYNWGFQLNDETLEVVLLRLCERNRILDWLQQGKSLTELRNLLTSRSRENIQNHNNGFQLNLNALFLTNSHMPTIVGYLKEHEEVQELNLSGNSLLQEGLKTLFAALDEIPWVISLNLAATSLSLESMQLLKNLLIKNKFLSTLDISNNNLQDEHLAEIVAIIKLNESLTTLIINNNKFLEDNKQELVEALYQNTTSTTFYCDILPKGVLSGVCKRNKVLALLQQHKPLTELCSLLKSENQKRAQSHDNNFRLDLNNLYLTDAQMPAIIKYLQEHEEVQELDLSGNSLLQKGLKNLFTALQEIPWVTSLNLAATNLSLDLESMKALKHLLIKNKNLLILDISNNNLQDEHLAEIIAIIKQNKSLMKLIITDNGFSKNHNHELAVALFQNTALTTFYCDVLSGSNKQDIEEFFMQARFGVGVANKKKSKNPNYRLEKVAVVKQEEWCLLNYSGKLNNFQKEIKKALIALMEHIKQGENNKDKGALLTESRSGADFKKFKELLSRLTPYIEGQEGYLQHILVKKNQKQYLEYLFNNFFINPWLRFNGKTILDVDVEENEGRLKDKIESYIHNIKNPGSQGLPLIASSSTRELSMTESSSSKRRRLDASGLYSSTNSSSNSASMLDELTTVPPSPAPIVSPNFSLSPSFSSSVDISEMDVFLVMLAIQNKQNLLIEAKWKPGINHAFQTFTKQTPLQYAIQIQAIQCIPTLIKLGEDINQRDDKNWPLIYQFISSFVEKSLTLLEIDNLIFLLKELIQNNASVSDKVTDDNIKQNTALHKAAQLGNYRAAKILLSHPDCPVNETNSEGRTPLIDAVVNNHFKLVARLILDRRHIRATVLKAQQQAQQLRNEAIQKLLEKHLNTIEESCSAGLLWSRNLMVQFSKPALGNQPVYRVSLDKEHAWLHSQNSFTQKSLTFDEEERKSALKDMGNPVTASLTFILTTTPYQRQTQPQYVDVTIALNNIPDYHITQFFDNTSEEVSQAERTDVIKKQKVLNMLPTYHNFRNGYQPKQINDIDEMHNADFVQTFRHGERSLIAYLADERNLQEIVHTLTQQSGFVAHAKCKGVVLNIASPRYPCENCEVALLATQNSCSDFLPLLSAILKNAGIQVPRFSVLRMVTCISSYIPFHSGSIPFEKHSLLDIDFRNQEILLVKDITQIDPQKSYTQFKSNQFS